MWKCLFGPHYAVMQEEFAAILGEQPIPAKYEAKARDQRLRAIEVRNQQRIARGEPIHQWPAYKGSFGVVPDHYPDHHLRGSTHSYGRSSSSSSDGDTFFD